MGLWTESYISTTTQITSNAVHSSNRCFETRNYTRPLRKKRKEKKVIGSINCIVNVLFSPCVFISVSLCLCLSLCLFLSGCLFLSVLLSVSLSLCLFLSVCLSSVSVSIPLLYVWLFFQNVHNRSTERETHTHRQRQKQRQTERKGCRQRETDRQTDRHFKQ